MGIGLIIYALGTMWTTRSDNAWHRGDSRWWMLATLIGLGGYAGGILGGYGAGGIVIAGAYILTRRTKVTKTV